MIEATDFNKITKHLTITSASDIDNIVMPILKKHGIIYFNFYKEYFNGTVIRLSNHLKWAEHYFQNQYIKETAKIPASLIQKRINYFIWDSNDWVNDVLLDAAINFKIGNGISITKVYPDSIESFGFGADITNHRIINHFYINNLDWLEQFCEYFKDQAADLINQCNETPILLPNYIEKSSLPIIHDVLGITPLHTLSKQQTRCAELLLKGYSIKEIAKQMNLSPRTVEFYIANIKTKLNCQSKTDLIIRLNSLLLLKG